MHYHFLQRVFTWEMQDSVNEDIEFIPVSYYKNKDTLNELLGKPDGVLSVIDDASKKGFNARYVTSKYMFHNCSNKIRNYNSFFLQTKYEHKL